MFYFFFPDSVIREGIKCIWGNREMLKGCFLVLCYILCKKNLVLNDFFFCCTSFQQWLKCIDVKYRAKEKKKFRFENQPNPHNTESGISDQRQGFGNSEAQISMLKTDAQKSDVQYWRVLGGLLLYIGITM